MLHRFICDLDLYEECAFLCHTMSSSVIASLIVTYQQVIIYAGIPIFIVGILGGLFNTLVFLSLRTFRESSCAFYLTILSMVNIGQLMTGLLSRIMISGFDVDWTRTSLLYCKFRTFFFQTTSLLSLAAISLATIDQYFATCSRPRWQQWSDIRIARRLFAGFIVLIAIEQSPCLIFYDHRVSLVSNGTVCTITNVAFESFNTYFNYLTLGNLLPHLTTFCFGIMAHRHVLQLRHRTVPLVRRELDKQLTTMVLVQVVCDLCLLMPTLIMYMIAAYGNIRNPVARAQVNLAYAVSLCLYYAYFAVSLSSLSRDDHRLLIQRTDCSRVHSTSM